MGAWGVLAFDNDSACDWASGLEGVDDLSLVQEALDAVDEDEVYLEASVATDALAACEVIARLRGAPGYQNPYTEAVDEWVKSHPIAPSPSLRKKAHAAIDRVLGIHSELRELWEESEPEYDNWVSAVEDLRERMG